MYLDSVNAILMLFLLPSLQVHIVKEQLHHEYNIGPNSFLVFSILTPPQPTFIQEVPYSGV